MKTDVKLLAQICEAPGAPGYEQKIRSLVLKHIKGLADKVEQDNIGNVYAIKKGKDSSKRVMIAAHMDEIGVIVTHIDEKGF
ncbi:MAG TPA: peptidase M28, partial [Chitinophagales bacterium]|nr:peptidase M28 [Chitinophagales bacterium]